MSAFKSLLVASASLSVQVASALNVAVNLAPSSPWGYTVSLDGVNWFTSDVYAVRNNGALFTSGNGGLTFTGPANPLNGVGGPLPGALPYTGYELAWQSGGQNLFTTRFYVYNGLNGGANGAVVFEQEFPVGLTNAAVGNSSE
jgi:hypothetical protein